MTASLRSPRTCAPAATPAQSTPTRSTPPSSPSCTRSCPKRRPCAGAAPHAPRTPLRTRADAPEEGATRLRDAHAPAEGAQAPFELARRMRHLHHAMSRAVEQLPAHRRAVVALEQFGGSAVRVVEEEHPPARTQAVTDQRPERLEALVRDV